MLRDNVQHHLEHGAPSAEFSALHAIGEAPVVGSVRVPAVKLREEMLRARELLSAPLADLAVSVRTRAVCARSFPLPTESSTMLVSEVEWTSPFPTEGLVTLGDVFGSLVEELLRITEGARAEDEVEVLET